MKKRYGMTSDYNRERLERLSIEKSFKQIERDAIRDGVVTDREVKEMLKAYDRENINRDVKLKERLAAYGYSISVDKWAHQIKVVASSSNKPKEVSVELQSFYRPFHVRYQKRVFLAIVLPAIVLSLIGLL